VARSERLALLSLILILIGLPLLTLGYQYVLRPKMADVRVIDIVAAAPETGGFHPESIRVAAGEPVRLRFSVPDVTHGIALGPGLDLDLGQVDPGEVQEVDVTFDRPGRYTYYCNSWCSPNHWRMRGTIEVYDPVNPEEMVVDRASDPVLDALMARGVDIDAVQPASAVPVGRPSASRGAAIVDTLGSALPAELADPAWGQSHSPVQAWDALVKTGVDGDDAWDVAAYLWLSELDPSQLPNAETLYAKNCAACHGEDGNGQGPGAAALSAQDMDQHGHAGTQGGPTPFSDPQAMLGRTSEILYAKLRRGGMGTGMPGFGPLFTPGETWLLVGYLWTFVFDR
jgi:plastocyanin